MPTNSEIVTLAEVAAKTGISINTLRFWRHKGIGPKMFTLGRRVVAYKSDVESWVRAQANSAVGDYLDTGGQTPAEVAADKWDWSEIQEARAELKAGLGRRVTSGAEASAYLSPLSPTAGDTEKIRWACEQVARRIEAQAAFEGVRAQRIVRMCAEVARDTGTRLALGAETCATT